MYKEFIHFIFIFYFCLVPNIADANSYKTQNLKYDIKVDIPIGWEILPQEMLRQLDNATEATTGVDQSNNEILLAANCYTLNKKRAAIFRISVRKKIPPFTQGELADLTDSDFKYLLYEAINAAINSDKKFGIKTDIENLKVFTAKVDGLLALVTAKNVLSHGIDQAHILYNIPMSNYSIKIYARFNWDEEHIFKPIMKRIISSIKIGSNHDRGELILSRREQAQEEATTEAERNAAAVRAHNENFLGTIRRELPEYYAMMNDPARKAEAAKYQQDVYAWIGSKPYAEAAPLMEIAKHGRDVNQVVSLLKRYESERRGGTSKPDPTGALAVPGRGAPTAPARTGDKDDFDAGGNQVKEIEENIKSMRE